MAIRDLPITDISNLIPQKIPFIMVDTLLEFSPKKIVSSYYIPDSNLFIQDNQFLESGLIENMAQTVALHTGYDYFLKGEDAPTGYIGSIKKVEVFQFELAHYIFRVINFQVLVKGGHGYIVKLSRIFWIGLTFKNDKMAFGVEHQIRRSGACLDFKIHNLAFRSVLQNRKNQTDR